MADSISNSHDVIDVRNLIERVEELRDEIESYEDRAKAGVTSERDEDGDDVRFITPDGFAYDNESDAQDAALAALDLADERQELASLEAFLEGLCGNGGDHQWQGEWYPVTLIRDSYFEDYARETADDLYGREMRNTHWPFNCIDWERAASELQTDYSSTEFDGVTYWYR